MAPDKPPLLRVWCTHGALWVRVQEWSVQRTNRAILHTGAVLAQLNDRGESLPALCMCGRVVRPRTGNGAHSTRKIPQNTGWWRYERPHNGKRWYVLAQVGD